eukprot:g10814.t1
MFGSSSKNREVVPLTVEQTLELLEAATADPSATSPAAVLCRAERLLLKTTGATRVNAFLVDHWFRKLLQFSAAAGEEAAVIAGGSEGNGALHCGKAGAAGRQGHTPRHETVFEARAVCDIGEGVAGMAAMTGRKLRIKDCGRQQQQQHQQYLVGSACWYSTPHDSGSLICWPVRERMVSPKACVVDRFATAGAAAKEPPSLAQLEDVDAGDEADDHDIEPAETGLVPAGGAVLAVLQLHCAEGLLSAEAVGVLDTVGKLLVPLLTEALAREGERARRRSAEGLLSLSSLALQEVSVVDMVEEVVRAAQALAEAERACFFFVDDAADELWVAKAVDFDDAKVKVGEGLCGHAAATGWTVNVIDSYQDSRFDRRWDKLTGFVTRSVLCVPIPPPDQAPACSGCGNGGGSGERGGKSSRRVGSATALKTPTPPTPASTARFDVPRSPRPRRRRSSHQAPRPLAVLEVINKRGNGVFGEHDERALVRLCAGVEALLRRKSAEVSLLWSGMTERALIRKGEAAVSPGGGPADRVRIESTIMSLYSKASRTDNGVEEAPGEERAMRQTSAALRGGGVGGGGGGGGVDGARDGSGERRRSTRASERANGRLRETRKNGLEVASMATTAGLMIARWWRRTAKETAGLVDLDMNLFVLGSDKLLSLVGRFFRSMRLTYLFQISDQKMTSFLRGVEERYRPNAFHSLVHAVSVTHVAYTIVKKTQVNVLLRPLDKLALLVAAFCHDIDHPGNNNAYEVNILSPLALQHGDSSVLERHHIFTTYQVILEKGGANNIFSELTGAEFRDVRQTIVKAILGTDMSGHMQHCADVFQHAQKAKRLREVERKEAAEAAAAAKDHVVFSVERAEDRSFLTQAIVHCADLSGQVLNNGLALEWGRRILEEFRVQAALEAAAGLPVTTIADGDMETTMKGQHFFASKIVKPLWEPFVVLFPELAPLLNHLNDNCDHYAQEGSRLEKHRLSAADLTAPPPRRTENGNNNAGGAGSDDAEGLGNARKKVTWADGGGAPPNPAS